MNDIYIMHYDRAAENCYCLIYDISILAPISQVMTIEDTYVYLKEYYCLEQLAEPSRNKYDVWSMITWRVEDIGMSTVVGMAGVDCDSLRGRDVLKTNRAGPLGENIPSWPEIFKLYDENNIFRWEFNKYK